MKITISVGRYLKRKSMSVWVKEYIVFVTCKDYILLSKKMGSQSFVSWDPNGVFWMAQKWLRYYIASRCNVLGLDIKRPDQEDRLQPWDQQMHNASVWILSWHCNSERISRSVTIRNLITPSGTLRLEQYWQSLQPLTKNTKRLWFMLLMI